MRAMHAACKAGAISRRPEGEAAVGDGQFQTGTRLDVVQGRSLFYILVGFFFSGGRFGDGFVPLCFRPI